MQQLLEKDHSLWPGKTYRRDNLKPFTIEELNNLLVFLDRVTLQGHEAGEFQHLRNKIHILIREEQQTKGEGNNAHSKTRESSE